MRGLVCIYLWVCLVAYFTRGGASLPAILGNELVVAEEEEPGLLGWMQGEETPLTHRFWGEAEGDEEEEEMEEGGDEQGLSFDSDKRQYPGGKRQYPGGKRQYPGGKRQYPGGKRQYPGGKRQYPGGKRQYPGGKRQYPGGKRSAYVPEEKRQFVGGEQELIPSPELRQYPGGKRQYPGGKRQYPGGKRQYPGGKRQWLGGKRSAELAEEEQDLFPMDMETRQYPGGKRQFPSGKRQYYLAGKRQYPGGKRQFPGGKKRQFIGGEALEQEAAINKRFVPEEDNIPENVDFLKLAQLYGLDNDILVNEEDFDIEDLLGDMMVDTRPEVEDPLKALLSNAESKDAMAIDLATLLQDRNEAHW